MTAGLGEADLARMRRGGHRGALRRARPRALRRGARRRARPQALAVPIDAAGLRALAAAGALPPILSGLVRAPQRRRAAAGSLAAKLADAARGRARGLRPRPGPRRGRRGPRPRLGRGGRARAGPSRSSASTRWPRSSCATGSTRRPACAWRRRSSSTTRAPPRSPSTCWPRRARSGAAQAGRGPRPGERRADRDRRHGLPLPRRGRLARGALAAGRRGPRRHRRVPRRPRLGPRAPLRPRPRPPRHQLRPRGRLPRRRRRVRRRVLRHRPARGAGDGPPAAPAAGSLLGGAGGRRHRPGLAARRAGRRLRRGQLARTTAPAPRRSAASSRATSAPAAPPASPPAASPTRSASRARRSPSTPPAPPRWSRCTWPRRRCAAGECTLALAGGVDGPRRPRRLHRVQPPARPRPRRALQVLRRGGRRRRLGRRASACSSSSASPTRSATATRSSP